MANEGAKAAIENLVKQYIALYSEEFELFKLAHKEKQSQLMNDFAEVKGGAIIERAIFEIPDTLNTILLMKLSAEDHTWWRSKEGGRWFARMFPVFAAGTRV